MKCKDEKRSTKSLAAFCLWGTHDHASEALLARNLQERVTLQKM